MFRMEELDVDGKTGTSRKSFLVTMILFLVIWFAYNVDKESVRKAVR